MRKIIVATFLSMGGVLQAPGGPHEDPSNGFKWGGWNFPYWDDMMNNTMGKMMSEPFDLLLGRRTFEIFSAHWPYQNDEIGVLFNRINKYVVATKPVDLSWQHSNLVTGDVVSELQKLKQQDAPNLLVHGSGRLCQTLFSHNLVNELHLWTFPVTLGPGKKLFQEGTRASRWKLINSVISTTGVVIASYIPDGEVRTGSFVPDNPSEAEIARRERWAKE